MILHFSDPPEYLNIDFSNCEYDRVHDPGAHYVKVSLADYVNILKEIQRGGYKLTEEAKTN